MPSAPPVRSGTPDFGNLQILFPMEGGGGGGIAVTITGIRQIIDDAHVQVVGRKKNVQNKEEGKDDDSVEPYYAFDDDYLRNTYQLWEDDRIQDKRKCRRVSWHRFVILLLHDLTMA